ncbi:hypothetical protein [Nocardia carnea]|uniref:hypothetical protein n=1 Tax=Nocardia carnea TaxID=37328 RepID=UPI002453B8AE|nr:hypothetical protein [Nocardia carnea]
MKPFAIAIGFAATITAATVAVAGCGDTRVCEHDDTDTRVAATYCSDGVPGYEWEDTAHAPTVHTKTVQSKPSANSPAPRPGPKVPARPAPGKR